MDDPILLQKQIRDNAEEMQSYLADMREWLKEMKRKQDPDLDNSVKEKKSHVTNELEDKQAKHKSPVKAAKKQAQRISSYDYAKWDNFDVEKACEEIDQKDIPQVVCEEPDEQEKQRLRDQALYEKELGNEQVKKQNWKGAIQYYNRAINCYAYDPTFYANRALCFLKTKESKSAEADCTTALQLDPTYVKALVRRATARTELRQFQDAKEDLERALQFEPDNTVAKNDLGKLEKLLSSPSETVFTKKDSVKTVKSPQPSPKPTAKELKSALNEEALGKGRGDAQPIIPWRTEEVKLVQTIYKPPHLRSKKPLKRITIRDVCSDDVTNVKGSSGDGPAINREKSLPVKTEPAANSELVSPTPTANSELVPPTPTANSELVPPTPKSSVQFHTAWKMIRSNKTSRFKYLKQICAEDLPKIFENSLESDDVTDLVSVLWLDFVEAGEPVYSYLLGLSKVQRFKALALFLTKADKTNVKKLLDHCVTAGECSRQEGERLAKQYEV